MRELKDCDMIRMLFWDLHTDDDPLDNTDLLRMADDLQAIAEDAVSYWIATGHAPEICDPKEDE